MMDQDGKDGLVVTVMVSEGKTLASDGMEVFSGKNGGRECRGVRV